MLVQQSHEVIQSDVHKGIQIPLYTVDMYMHIHITLPVCSYSYIVNSSVWH